jgi:hypothetical protein
MAAGPITLAMLKHHAIINRFLSNFEKDGSKSVSLFNLFKWNSEKHFFVEEANIFPVTDKDNKKEAQELKNLLKDHKDLREIAENISDELNDGDEANVKVLRELLFAHERREVEIFYPLLDKRLSPEQKKDILEKVSDIVLG